jgi:hypothetical protein
MTAILICVAIAWIGFLIFAPWYSTSKVRKAGYKAVQGVFWEKGGEIFFILHSNLNKATPIEIVEVSEIRRNSHLCGLEMRYRLNGQIKQVRFTGTSGQMLTLEDKLGYVDWRNSVAIRAKMC